METKEIGNLVRRDSWALGCRHGSGAADTRGLFGLVTSVSFSLDGMLVASGSYDEIVRLWDAVTGAALQTLEGHSKEVTLVAFSPDGKLVASGSYDETVGL